MEETTRMPLPTWYFSLAQWSLLPLTGFISRNYLWGSPIHLHHGALTHQGSFFPVHLQSNDMHTVKVGLTGQWCDWRNNKKERTVQCLHRTGHKKRVEICTENDLWIRFDAASVAVSSFGIDLSEKENWSSTSTLALREKIFHSSLQLPDVLQSRGCMQYPGRVGVHYVFCRQVTLVTKNPPCWAAILDVWICACLCVCACKKWACARGDTELFHWPLKLSRPNKQPGKKTEKGSIPRIAIVSSDAKKSGRRTGRRG